LVTVRRAGKSHGGEGGSSIGLGESGENRGAGTTKHFVGQRTAGKGHRSDSVACNMTGGLATHLPRPPTATLSHPRPPRATHIFSRFSSFVTGTVNNVQREQERNRKSASLAHLQHAMLRSATQLRARKMEKLHPSPTLRFWGKIKRERGGRKAGHE